MEQTKEIQFFEDLCCQYYQKIFQYILVKVHQYDVAQDLVQHVFAVAWEKRQVVQNHQAPLGFLYVTAQNLSYSYLRKAKKMPLPLDDSFDPSTEDKDIGETLLKEADTNINEEAYVEQVIDTLPKDSLDLYREYYMNHRSTKEIAKRNGVSEVSVRMRLVRLRKRIKKEVAKQNFDFL